MINFSTVLPSPGGSGSLKEHQFIPTNNHPAYFVTINVFRRTKLFVRDDLFKIIIDAWKYYERHEQMVVCSYVVMPDHIHFIFYFYQVPKKLQLKTAVGLRGKYKYLSNDDIKKCITRFKQFTAHAIIRILKLEHAEILQNVLLKHEKARHHWYKAWQTDQYIVAIHDLQSLKVKQQYIHNNPVKAGLVENYQDYPYIK